MREHIAVLSEADEISLMTSIHLRCLVRKTLDTGYSRLRRGLRVQQSGISQTL